MRRSQRLAWSVVGALLWANAGPLWGQDVCGVVVEAVDGRAVEGAFVSLLDQRGETFASTLSAIEGTFRLVVRARGTYRLRVERIGYDSWVSEPFEADPERPVRRRLEISVRPVALRELAVTVESRHAGRPAGGAGLARVWEEACKALEMTRWTERDTGKVGPLSWTGERFGSGGPGTSLR